ncbi:Sec-independent protein translocase subunit TatA [Xylanimonas protaetiae]|uniref:Sec-independent protein translocase protein TatA n=1 Tax=Xylanimonas protaetiae TaxID=2509457 RepID=A0A4P6F5N1_9MICO|nr:Sec-independent protein translocase subunit TatA [Xylanimonas protaetiae]QAY71022.1 Sec-independent protein translocase subunit TatA [Xylanimonas protaetiae]
MLRGGLQPWHIILVLVVIFLLFGANRLPGLAKSVGESLKIFKKEIKDLTDDGTPAPAAPPATPPAAPAPPASTDQGPLPGTVDPNHPKA